MEDILASIKRIIADDTAAALASSQPRSRPVAVRAVGEAPSAEAEILELTQPVAPTSGAASSPGSAESLVSADAAAASRQSLAALSNLLISTSGGEHTLEALVRDMLRPLLKEWLDARLPDLVESLVAREIARITARGL